MEMNRLLKGLFLLATFGAVCGTVAGVFFGTCAVFFFVSPVLLPLKEVMIMLLYGWVIGALTGLLPGVLYGLASFNSVKTWHWALDGGFWGGVGFLLITMITDIRFSWAALLICTLCGFFAGMLNGVFSNWWGRKLHAEAVTLLRRTT